MVVGELLQNKGDCFGQPLAIASEEAIVGLILMCAQEHQSYIEKCDGVGGGEV